jgi:hypothetical protein
MTSLQQTSDSQRTSRGKTFLETEDLCFHDFMEECIIKTYKFSLAQHIHIS